MEKHMDSLLSSYENEISQLDSQQWEKDLPTRITDIKSAKKTKIKSEMIDVDLVRGSTFPKPKSRRGLLPLCLKSWLSVMLFPLAADWWTTRSNLLIYSAGCFVYFSSLLNIYLHFSHETETHLEDRDVLEPVLMFGLLVFLQTYIHHNPRERRKSTAAMVGQASSAQGMQVRRSSCKIYSRKASADDLFSWNKSKRKSDTATGATTFYQEVCSDIESISGNICSDNDSLEEMDPLSPNTNSDQDSNSEDSEEDQMLSRPLRKVSREKKNERFRSSRENSNDTTRRLSPTTLKIGCTVWHNEEPSKIHLSALEIGSAIFERSCEMPDSNLYAGAAVVFASILAVIPGIFKYQEVSRALAELLCPHNIAKIVSINRMNSLESLEGVLSWYNESRLILLNLLLVRLILLTGFFFLLAVTERAFRRKFMIAKLFSQITSTRRATKSNIPHFRLYKVRNIKGWLCVRSFLRKRGPKRTLDLIVSVGILIGTLNLLYLCYQLLKEDDPILKFDKTNVEVISYCIFIGTFIIRFVTLSARINQKYMNLSVLLTEQINLYLRMEEKPQKKEQLLLANNVLKLSSDLLKELDKRSHDILGLSTNPLLYNITKLIVLSAVSGALSEMLGFKLKLYKVKIK